MRRHDSVTSHVDVALCRPGKTGPIDDCMQIIYVDSVDPIFEYGEREEPVRDLIHQPTSNERCSFELDHEMMASGNGLDMERRRATSGSRHVTPGHVQDRPLIAESTLSDRNHRRTFISPPP